MPASCSAPQPPPRGLLAELRFPWPLHLGPACRSLCHSQRSRAWRTGRTGFPSVSVGTNGTHGEVKGEAILGNTDAGHRLFSSGFENIWGAFVRTCTNGAKARVRGTHGGSKKWGSEQVEGGGGPALGGEGPGDGARTCPLCSVASGRLARASGKPPRPAEHGSARPGRGGLSLRHWPPAGPGGLLGKQSRLRLALASSWEHQTSRGTEKCRTQLL